MINIENLHIGYKGKVKSPTTVAKNINCSAREGELTALIGENGIGKSTLLRNMVHLQDPLAGKIYLKNKLLAEYPRTMLPKILSYVSTELVQTSNISVYELVSFGRLPYTNWIGKLTSADRQKVEESLEMVNIQHLAHKNIYEISDGEKQRALIARSIAQDTEIIILDEPTAFLDLHNRYEIIHLLHNLSFSKGKTIVFSTHELNIALQIVDKIWLMIPNQFYEGAPEDLIIKGVLRKTFEKYKHIYFDDEKFEFNWHKQVLQKINLVGDTAHHKLMKKALERIFFETGQSDLVLGIIDKKDSVIMELEENNQKKTFESIYDLILYLKKYVK